MKKILVLGAAGQIGSELVVYLRNIYGADNVVAADVHKNCPDYVINGTFEIIDALDGENFRKQVLKYNIDTIFNLVAMLSAKGEANPVLAWKLNMGALFNSLEIAREIKGALFTPSSIGAFGPSTPMDMTPQDTLMRPNTVYGISKVAGELLSDYYYEKFGVDARGVRYPVLSPMLLSPGGGTTDYAVEIYYEAIKKKSYTCNLPAGAFLDMMYMPDALKAAVQLMEADPSRLKHRNCFNVTAMSLDPEIMAKEIKKHIPEFTLDYKVDPVKVKIAATWPNSMDDSIAREEWDWKHEYDLATMTVDMLEVLGKKLK